MMGKMTIIAAADRLAERPGPMPGARRRHPETEQLIADIIAAAKAGLLAAVPAPPPPDFSRVLFSAHTSRSSIAVERQQGALGINEASQVDFFEVCVWFVSTGGDVPERAFRGLTVEEGGKLRTLIAARSGSSSGDRPQKKISPIIGAMMLFLKEHRRQLPARFFKGGSLNVSGIADWIRAQIGDEHGDSPPGFGQSSIEKTLSKGLKDWEEILKSRTLR